MTWSDRVRGSSISKNIVLSLLVPWVGGCFTAAPAGELGGTPAPESSSGKCFTSDEAEKMADHVLQLVNLERGEANLPPVVHDPTLSKIAAEYACRMIEEDFFGHDDPLSGHGPGERAVASRYLFYAVGENLAAGQDTAADAMKVWMESPSHRGIVLDERWTEVGIAVRFGGKHGIYWVQEFGDPARGFLPPAPE